MNRGYTLVEILAVLSIIGILSAIIVGNVRPATVRGLDAKIQTDLRSMQLALQLYYDAYGRMPGNKDAPNGYCNTQPNFLSELVPKYLPTTIQRQVSSDVIYCYYDYGQGTSVGAILVTNLQGASPSTEGYSGTCRPWSEETSWCNTASSNTYYCLCNPY